MSLRYLHSPRARVGVTLAGAFVLTLVASYEAGCSVDHGIVGGACAAGYLDCNDQCIRVASDPQNCGACGNVCASGVCSDGKCAARADAGPDAKADARPDAMRDAVARDGADGTVMDAADAAHPDGAQLDGSKDGALADGADGADAPDAHASDARLDGALDGSADSAVDSCAPPYATVTSCGGCGVTCQPAEVCTLNPDAGVDAGAYACAPACTAPLVDCSGTCIDETNDPENCGACGRVCPSGICVNKACAGSTAGDIVIIGHDYASSNVHLSEAAILSNAVFLPQTNPLRVLSFEQYADTAQVANARQVLKQAALASGRTVNLTTVTDFTAVPADIIAATFDVLLVYDQPNAPSGMLQTIGQAWQMSIGEFLAVGGDVVVLDGASGATPQMPQLLSSANLLQTTGEAKIASGTKLVVVASGDAVGNFVVSPYAAQNDTVSFITNETNGGSVTFVVEQPVDGGSAPVVIHKTL
jgi:hypothetical protein